MPYADIDQSQFEKLCQMQCTKEEIASWFGVCQDTLGDWCKRVYKTNFHDAYEKYSQNGKITIRRLQFRLAEKSVPMAIWLGKQYLGQRDQVEVGPREDVVINASIPMSKEEAIPPMVDTTNGD